jgi:hypothetical protein
MSRSKRFIPFITLVATALACAIPGFVSPGAVSTSAAETVIAGLTHPHRNIDAHIYPDADP